MNESILMEESDDKSGKKSLGWRLVMYSRYIYDFLMHAKNVYKNAILWTFHSHLFCNKWVQQRCYKQTTNGKWTDRIKLDRNRSTPSIDYLNTPSHYLSWHPYWERVEKEYSTRVVRCALNNWKWNVETQAGDKRTKISTIPCARTPPYLHHANRLALLLPASPKALFLSPILSSPQSFLPLALSFFLPSSSSLSLSNFHPAFPFFFIHSQPFRIHTNTKQILRYLSYYKIESCHRRQTGIIPLTWLHGTSWLKG